MAERPIRILLVDDHALFRQGLRQLLATTEDLVVVGEAASGSEALELAGTLAPDIVLMDIAMPDLDGIAATAALHQRFPQVRVVMLTMYDATTHGEAARAAGAVAYVVKSSRPDELFQAIRSAANGSGPTRPAEPLRPLAPATTDEADRLAHLERRLRWLEEQFAALAARSSAPALPPNGRSEERTAAVSAEAKPSPQPPDRPAAEHAPPAPAATSAAPVTVPSRRRATLPVARRLLPLWLGAIVALAALMTIVVLRPSLAGPVAPWITLASTLLASWLLLALALPGRSRPTQAHVALLLAIGLVLAWSLAVTHLDTGLPRGAVTTGILGVSLPALALAWRRDFLLAAALALAATARAPALEALLPPVSSVAWITALVLAATLLVRRTLQASRTEVAWEWLPLAPLAAGIPSLIVAGHTGDRLTLLVLSMPWVATFPSWWWGVRTGRSVTLPVTGAALLALGTFGWLLRAAPPATQAASSVVFALCAAVLALLLWRAAPDASVSRRPVAVAAALAAAGLLFASTRHPEPILAPLTWLALAVVLASSGHQRIGWHWAALALFLAGCFASLRIVLSPPGLERFALLLAVLTLATTSGVVRPPRSWGYVVGWLTAGTTTLAALLMATVDGLLELAALSLLAVGAVSLARLHVIRYRPARPAWFWLPAALAGLLALARALAGPLSPARLGLVLAPAIPATSEPVIAASILIAAALAIGRLLGRRWRWAAIAAALLLVAYTLPAVIPDAALVVSWLALAIALIHALGGRPWR